MKQNLKIGIYKRQPGWQILLDQSGLAYEDINFSEKLSLEKYSVLIINDIIHKDHFALINDYLIEGGAILDVGFFISSFQQINFKSSKIKYIIPTEKDDIFTDLRIIDVFSGIKRHQKAQFLNRTVYLGEVNKGFIAHVAFDPNSLILNVENIRKQFYYPSGKFPNEIVAKISKNEIRKIVNSIIKWLHFKRGLPYVHLWYFPEKLKNIHLFRVDSDYSSRQQIEDLYAIAKKHNMKMTWFLHGQAHENWFEYFKSFQNQELAIHGYKHYTYDQFEKNYQNIKKCEELFVKTGLDYSGFASPYGSWNYELARAVDECRFAFASEFSLDYDNLPFYPYLKDHFSSVLQIPFHPVCVGNLNRVKATDEEMIEYYKFVISEKLAFNEPLAFYDHPGHPFNGVVSKIFSYINEMKIKNITLGEYANWWKKRATANYSVQIVNQGIDIQIENPDNSVSLCVWRPDESKSYCLVNDPGFYTFNKMTFSKMETGFNLQTSREKIRKFNPRFIHYNYLDKKWRKED